jgi:diaminopimelate decarboxylase
MTDLSATVTSIDRNQVSAAERLGTPLFYYSLKTLRAQIATFRSCLSSYPVRLLFATMANDRAEILRTIADEGVGACINSIPHLQRALDCGFDVRNVQFTSCGIPAADMAFLQSRSIIVNLDSVSQIRQWCTLKRGAVAGARINAASLARSTEPPDRIGMDLADFEEARDVARRLDGRVNGVHVYAGTNFQSAREILAILRSAFELVRASYDLDYINIGGGVGIDYGHSGEGFDYREFGAEVCALARGISQERGWPIEVLFEPGRSLVGSSGTFITRVTDVKSLGDTRFIVVDGSVSVFPRPFHVPGSYHKVRVLDPAGAPAASGVPSKLVGRTTFSRDILGSYELPRDLSIGALLSFEDAGAYCESMISRFLGQREPNYYIDQNEN